MHVIIPLEKNGQKTRTRKNHGSVSITVAVQHRHISSLSGLLFPAGGQGNNRV